MNDRPSVAFRETGASTIVPFGAIPNGSIVSRVGASGVGITPDGSTAQITGGTLSVASDGVALGTITHQQVIQRIMAGF